MKTLFNPKPISIKMTVSEISELWNYLDKCRVYGFSGINNYKHHHPEREFMYTWHLSELAGKVLVLKLKYSQDMSTNQVSLKVTLPEQRTMSVMFNRVEATPYMLQLQTRFINKLIPLKK